MSIFFKKKKSAHKEVHWRKWESSFQVSLNLDSFVYELPYSGTDVWLNSTEDLGKMPPSGFLYKHALQIHSDFLGHS